MNWASASDFFAMGGYGLYVWGSYGVAAVVITAEALLARRRHQQALAQVRAEHPLR
jgi:heme exporter protein D